MGGRYAVSAKKTNGFILSFALVFDKFFTLEKRNTFTFLLA